ncbi:hypothetical protein Pcinc_006013 [Petrolisthes cinctipes]|uniref:Uncharacterized protein n=1 Tax=Petrolisthes cinctipes TaxID=88211 RepID=A0AAE1KYG5_PETCI|nr:hypothetical protein Pcinc_006013 [Petrolisthes cinctipes]
MNPGKSEQGDSVTEIFESKDSQRGEQLAWGEAVSALLTEGKRSPVDSDGVDCLPPAAKTAKGASAVHDVPSLPQRGVSSLYTNSLPSSNLPAFAPRNAYVKLSFSGNPSTDTKLRWLSDVNRAFQLQRELAEVKMAAVTSRFVYISRKRQDIIDRVKAGEFLSLPLIVEDSPERPRKFPSYILTRFPIDVDPKLAKGYPGVYFARRFFQDGSPISRIVVVWSQPDPPPNEISSLVFHRVSPASPPDLALRKSVATLMARCTALENRFSALEARINGLVAAQAANDSKLSTLVEAQQAIISTVTTLTEKMDTVASRLEKLFESVPSPGPSSPGRSSAPTHRTSTSKYRVR